MSVKPSSSATRQLSRIKVISMGEERVGKSCLIKRFCEEKFVDKYVPTIGIDFGVKPVSVEQSGTVRINFWDMAGGSEYYAVRSEFYPDAQGAMLVFDVCNKASFDKLGTWMKEARVHGAPSSMCYVVGVKGWPYHRKLGMATSFWPYECGHAATSVDRTICMVCGNKTDASRRRTIPEAEGRRFASEIGAPYYETSAKDGSGVVPMFEDLFKRVCVARASALSGD